MLSSLFSYSHISPNTKLWQYILLLMYCPFGLYLLMLRIFGLIFLSVFIFLAPNDFVFPCWIVRILAPLFGVVSSIKKGKKVPSSTILACNHRTAFDVFPFLSLQQVSVLIDKGFFETSRLAKPFQKIISAIPLDRTKTKQDMRDEIVSRLKSSTKPLLFFPEGWDTNGKTGLMVYQKFLFSLGLQIQPVALKVSVPLLPFIEPGILGSSITREFCWLFFVPFMYFELEYLPVCKQEERETDIEFAKRVQCMTAASLGIQATHYSNKDALVLRKTIVETGKIPQ